MTRITLAACVAAALLAAACHPRESQTTTSTTAPVYPSAPSAPPVSRDMTASTTSS